MPLFHSAPLPLGEGSIILPGNWGRIVTAIGPEHPKWEMEQIFERVRVERFPNLPSRLGSAFCCLSEEALRFFVEKASKSKFPALLYEVELVDEDASRHTADYNLIDILFPEQTHETNAVRYWEGQFRYTFKDHPGWVCEEVITASPLRITRRLA
ncbi:hypothetical protein ACTJKE_09395 [Ensifer sp. 22521]|uniref:hypothetical protein n=1 Tax=Ensifer sp. 22521 TaxID=3453935 RepID=UPI003F853C54